MAGSRGPWVGLASGVLGMAVVGCFDPERADSAYTLGNNDESSAETSNRNTDAQSDSASVSSISSMDAMNSGPTNSGTATVSSLSEGDAMSDATGGPTGTDGTSSTLSAGASETLAQATDGSTTDAPVSCTVVPRVSDPRIDDFETGDAVFYTPYGTTGYWYSFSFGDVSAATFDPSLGAFAPSARTDSGGGYAAVQRSSGLQVTDPASGFAVECSLNNATPTLNCSVDASDFAGVTFLAQGAGLMRLEVVVPAQLPVVEGGECETDCYRYHGILFELSPDWVQYTARFEQMTQLNGTDRFDPSRIIAIHWLMATPDGTAQDTVLSFAFDDVTFIRE